MPSRSISKIKPPIVIFVDASGSPDFKASHHRTVLLPYIPCAVAVPALAYATVRCMLPVDSTSGKRLKSSDLGMTDEIASVFIEDLLSTSASIALVCIDPTCKESIATAEEATQLANEIRALDQRKRISKPNLMYAVLAAEAVIGAWGIASKNWRHLLSFLDVTFDRESLGHTHAKNFQIILQDYKKISFNRIAWASVEDEPLLLVPDLIAGVVHRQFTRGDCPRSWKILQEAATQGRIHIQDGKKFYTLPRRQM